MKWKCTLSKVAFGFILNQWNPIRSDMAKISSIGRESQIDQIRILVKNT